MHILQPQLLEHNVVLGRDYLFNLLARHKLLIKTRRRNAITTNSQHWMRKYPNLIRGMEITRTTQLWVSDITFIRLSNCFSYLSLITDAYSHKIIGYHLNKDPDAKGCIMALEMALAKSRTSDSLIHHSDRGCQYCCGDYVRLLNANNIEVSMTENGDPYENAIAERVNGILKKEFNLYSSHENFEIAQQSITSAIEKYNNLRPHASCDYLTPSEAHGRTGKLKKRWKNYHHTSYINP